MNEFDDRKEDVTMNENVACRLPNLDEKDSALAQTNTGWAQDMVENLSVGSIHRMDDYGVELQVVSEEAVRCVTVVDHPYCYRTLAMIAVSFETAGIDLQLDPYTVIRPFDPPEDNGSPPDEDDGEPGVEVV